MSDHSPNRAQRIWQVVSQIPKGRVSTYGKVAELAGLPGYARYVGHTLKQLPAGSKLPWHRVVNAQGRLSFPQGSDQYLRQQRLLLSEGIEFVAERLSLRQYQWRPERQD